MEKKCVIEKVYTRSENAIIPTILSFQNGDLTVTDEDHVQYCIMNNTKSKSKEALVLVDKQIYTGPINANDNLTDTYICVRNKITNKVRIVPIDQANLKNYMYTELYERDLKDKQRPANEETNKMKLAKEFRGRKAATVYDSGAKMKVSVEVIKDDLDLTVQETTINEDDLITKLPESTFETLCPKFNKEATSISEVYNMEDLMPASIMDRLDYEAKAVLKAEQNTLPIKSKFLLSYIESIKTDKSLTKSEILYKMKIVIFMDCLYNFIKSKERVIRKIALSGITEKIEVYMRKDFLGQPNKTSALHDKALCYFIVFCLLNDKKNTVNVSMLAEELGKSKATIITYARVVNAMPKATQNDIVTLKLPKQVPPLNKSFQKRGRKI